MKWFKFYGQDFLTDSKIGALNPLQRLMWVALLSVASQDEERTGVIKFLTEERLKELCGITDNPYNNDWSRTNVTLETFCNMGLITMPDENTIIIPNFNLKQKQQSTSTERVAEWRARNRAIKRPPDVTPNVTNVMLHSNGRVEKSRVDNNTAAKPQTTMKKNRMGSYREDAPQDSYDESIDLDTGEAIKPKERAGVLPAYKELVDWSQTRRGFKFLSIPKQYKAFKEAKTFGLMPADLKKRWLELEEDKFYAEKGFDWPTVVYSFNRKKK